MMKHNNPYYHPGQMGLGIVAQIDYSDGCHRFDLRVVWKHLKTGRFYAARDGGCSCPVPFEDYDTLEKLSPYSFKEIHDEATSVNLCTNYCGDSVADFLDRLPPTRQHRKQ